jgi:hypothetical protein
MSSVKKWVHFIFFLAGVSLLWMPLYGENLKDHKSKSSTNAAASGTEHAPAYPPMPGPGKKVSIGKDYYFIYGFDKKPSMGTVIMKVEVYTKDGKKDVFMEMKGDAGMPSMRGAHETRERAFSLSKKGAYLLPIDIVMPGDWEIRLTFIKAGKVIFRGSYQFDV